MVDALRALDAPDIKVEAASARDADEPVASGGRVLDIVLNVSLTEQCMLRYGISSNVSRARMY